MKLYGIMFNGNLAVSVDGQKRQNYKKGDRVVCDRNDRLNLIRLGCSQINEIEAEYSDVFSGKTIETPVPPVVADVPPVETNEVAEEKKLHWKQKLKLEREAAEAQALSSNE